MPYRSRNGLNVDSISRTVRLRAVSRQVIREGGNELLAQPVQTTASLNKRHPITGEEMRLFIPGLDNPSGPEADHLWVPEPGEIPD